MTYQRLNNIVGWIVFAIATYVYGSTIEPTASFWDCGEFIATADKLEVGHPPGAPLFMMIGRMFAFLGEAFLGGQEAMMINMLSALCSSFSILFLFWTITHMARKIVAPGSKPESGQAFAIIGAGIVGALAYTFSDSFWFSAVEGEVYAMSSLFTAVVYWAILKWEEAADEPHANRWLVLIAYLMGLSIGVHLLNLLAIPAIVFVYYFRKYEVNPLGIVLAGVISVVILGFVQYGIIPQTVYLAAQFEKMFANDFGAPLNVGWLVFLSLIVALLTVGLYMTRKSGAVLVNTALLCITVIMIGYSSFGMIVVRSAANPPMDENNPENAFTLLSYLNREQYGDRPLLRGQFWDSTLDPQKPYEDGKETWVQDKEKGRYVKTDDGKGTVPNYNPKLTMTFPRMYSGQPQHKPEYIYWSDFKGTIVPNVYNPQTGETKAIRKPTMGENMRFFFSYQIGWMYARYFFWNFSGRQNDIQGHRGPLEGNWITGINAIDSQRLGSQDDLPKHWKDNPGRNAYYMLPFLLGLLGFFFQAMRSPKDFTVVGLLFFFTGLAIVIYLNQYPLQPRERDYAYAASFYGYAIWIGLGTLALYEGLRKAIGSSGSAIAATVVCTLLVPGIMAKENWDDHDRSNTYTARDFAKNYLNSCEEGAILFTNGDNDTFPLWYVQEVEEYRTDVRVCNLSLLNTDWYIDQMRRKAYDSEPVPFSFKPEEYQQGTRDYIVLPPRKGDKKRFVELSNQMAYISNNKNLQGDPRSRQYFAFKSRDFKLPIDSTVIAQNGVIAEKYFPEMVKEIRWSINKSVVMKNDMMVLDLLNTNNWERPVYFAITTGNAAYIGLQGHFQLEGLSYRLVPYKTKKDKLGQPGRVDTDIMYKNVMEEFVWGGMDVKETVSYTAKGGETIADISEALDVHEVDLRISNPEVDFDNLAAGTLSLEVPRWIYLNDNNQRMCMNLRNNFVRLANQLIADGDMERAELVLDRCLEVMPVSIVPMNYFMLGIMEGYYAAGAVEKGNMLARGMMDMYEAEVLWFAAQDREIFQAVQGKVEQSYNIVRELMSIVTNPNRYPQGERDPATGQMTSGLGKEFTDRFQAMTKQLPGTGGR